LKSVKTVLFDTEFSDLKSMKVGLFNGDFPVSRARKPLSSTGNFHRALVKSANPLPSNRILAKGPNEKLDPNRALV
jgi:hypothetical protein